MEAERRLKMQEDSLRERENAEKEKKQQLAGVHERERALVRSQAALLVKEKVLA